MKGSFVGGAENKPSKLQVDGGCVKGVRLLARDHEETGMPWKKLLGHCGSIRCLPREQACRKKVGSLGEELLWSFQFLTLKHETISQKNMEQQPQYKPRNTSIFIYASYTPCLPHYFPLEFEKV